MRRLLPSLVLGVILAVSLGFKASGQISAPGEAPVDDSADVVAFLQTHGFAVESFPAESFWISAAAQDCTLQIATISPFGWQRDPVMEGAGSARLVYVFAGETFSEQPVLRTGLTHYWQRLRGYLRQPSHQYPVRAVVAGDGCPPNILRPDVLGELSR